MPTAVSLVTPAYNQAEFLAATIDSVLAQTHDAIDYRVIDDGSTDATPSVLAGYGDRVRSERQANAGQAATLNRGWDAATGDYLGYLSSDDILYPQAIARVAAALDADQNAVAAFPQADWIDPAGRIIRRRVCRPFDLVETVIGQRCFIGPGALFRADAYRAVGGWNPAYRMGPDREFWMRLATRGRIIMVEEPLAGYRMHPQSLSFSEASEDKSREFIDVLDGYFARADVPAVIRARRDEAYAHAHLLVARNRMRAADLPGARRYLAAATRLHPPLARASTVASLARAAVSRPVRLAQARLRAVFG